MGQLNCSVGQTHPTHALGSCTTQMMLQNVEAEPVVHCHCLGKHKHQNFNQKEADHVDVFDEAIQSTQWNYGTPNRNCSTSPLTSHSQNITFPKPNNTSTSKRNGSQPKGNALEGWIFLSDGKTVTCSIKCLITW